MITIENDAIITENKVSFLKQLIQHKEKIWIGFSFSIKTLYSPSLLYFLHNILDSPSLDAPSLDSAELCTSPKPY